jgi:hypothetical protein
MKDALSALPEQLDTPVGEGGDAFSVGAHLCRIMLLPVLPFRTFNGPCSAHGTITLAYCIVHVAWILRLQANGSCSASHGRYWPKLSF